LSSDFSPPLVDKALGWAVAPDGARPADCSDASREAEDSGTGEWAGAVAASSAWAAGDGGGTAGGAVGGAGSWDRAVFTEVSPVKGFLYSEAEVMTSREVGL